MTKVTVFGQKEKKEEKKVIEFVYYLGDDGIRHPVDMCPQWLNVTLLSMSSNYDTIFAWDDNPQEDGVTYIGHWNDGVVG